MTTASNPVDNCPMCGGSFLSPKDIMDPISQVLSLQRWCIAMTQRVSSPDASAVYHKLLENLDETAMVLQYNAACCIRDKFAKSSGVPVAGENNKEVGWFNDL
jgi:hypothetical protein